MNKAIKIILLVVAIMLAVGGVMAYYKTIVSPPGKLEFSNQYVNTAKKDISKVKSANTDIALDTTFVGITHELDLWLSNSFLSDQERNELMESFAAQYVPTYVIITMQRRLHLLADIMALNLQNKESQQPKNMLRCRLLTIALIWCLD